MHTSHISPIFLFQMIWGFLRFITHTQFLIGPSNFQYWKKNIGQSMRSFFILMTSWNNVLWLAILHYIRLYIAHNPIDILREPSPIFHSYRVGTEWKQLYVHTSTGPDSKLCVAYKSFLPSCQFLLSFFISSFYLFHFPQLCALLSLHLNAKCGLMSEAEKLKASNTQIQAVGSLR